MWVCTSNWGCGTWGARRDVGHWTLRLTASTDKMWHIISHINGGPLLYMGTVTVLLQYTGVFFQVLLLQYSK